jgi:hypothetical protein
MTRSVPVIALACLAVVSAGCGSEPSAAAAAGSANGPKLLSGSDAGAMADLQSSAKWAAPRCRWLETGAHVLASPQDTAVLEAARDLGFVEMTQVGTGNRTGRVEPAWRIALTDAGKAESAKCGRGSTRSTTFGIPVSQRRFISGKRTAEPDTSNPTRTMFEVEFEWVPTAAGDRVKYVLTGNMAVEQGLAKATVSMLYGNRVVGKGANGWVVNAIHDARFASGR